jgi:hypothetical protein
MIFVVTEMSVGISDFLFGVMKMKFGDIPTAFGVTEMSVGVSKISTAVFQTVVGGSPKTVGGMAMSGFWLERQGQEREQAENVLAENVMKMFFYYFTQCWKCQVQ